MSNATEHQFLPLDHHTKSRQQMIRAYEEKLDRAKALLGKKWVFHPKNPNAPKKGIYNNFGLRVA